MKVGRYFLGQVIKCLKGHKSLGSLCSVVKTLIVRLVNSDAGLRYQPTKEQGHLLTWTAKNNTAGEK